MNASRRTFLSSLVTGAGSMALASCGSAPGRAARQSPQQHDDRFASLRGFCNGVTGPDDTERQRHRERARKLATDAGFAALVMEAGVDLGYYTGGRWGTSERPLIYVLPVSGTPFFVGPAFEERTLREAFVGDAELRVWQEHESPYELVAAGMAARELTGPVALDPLCRQFVVDGLGQIDGVEPRGGAELFAAVRMRKSESELARLRRANEATKAALKLVGSLVEPGMSEKQIADLVTASQEAAGLSRIWSLVLFGENAAYPHGTSNKRPLRDGDMVLVDTGGQLHGYQSDITRTWAVGKPSGRAAAAWQTVLDAQSAAMELLGPGVRCADVDRAARKVVEDAGFGAGYAAFTHRLGHGIGLQGHEHPYLVQENPQVLEPGMTMSNEPGIYVPGKWGVRIEDIVAITGDGVEVFGPRSASLSRPFG